MEGRIGGTPRHGPAREGNALRVRGSERITMMDYDVQPPRLMAGTMRVHAPVTVGFDVVLRP